MRAIRILLLVIPTVGAEPEELRKITEPVTKPASDEYFQEVEAARGKYRAKLAAILEKADAVEIYQFDGTTEPKAPQGQEEHYFPIVPYEQVSKIIARKRLTGDKLLECRKATASLMTEAGDSGVLCHYPAHGLRFVRGKEVIFETSICWKCQNFYIAYPDDKDASWQGITTKELQEFLFRELPLPAEEGTPGK